MNCHNLYYKRKACLLNFRSFLGQHGDSYDRFLIRMNEMAESLNIINQVIYKIIKHKKNSFKNKNFFIYTNINPHNIIRYTNPEF